MPEVKIEVRWTVPSSAQIRGSKKNNGSRNKTKRSTQATIKGLNIADNLKDNLFDIAITQAFMELQVDRFAEL